MKISRIFLIVIFLLSLLAGYSAGHFLFIKKNKSLQTPPQIINSSNSTGAQESLWLITIDQFGKSDPTIIGIWLLTYIPNYTKIKPLPFYPSENIQANAEIDKNFHLTSGQNISPEFWEYLQKHNFLVRNYIVIDKVVAANILDMYGGVTIQDKVLSGQDAMSQLSMPGVSPIESIQNQVIVLDCICKSIFNGAVVPNINILQKDIGKHIVSNLDLDIKLDEWRSLIINGDHKVCDFSDLASKLHITLKP